MTLEEFITSGIFRYGIFPILSAIAGILLKCVTRNDKYAFFQKEDVAVGPQLVLTAILTFVVVGTDRAHALVKANAQLKAALAAKSVDQQAISELQASALGLSQHMMGALWMLLGLFLMLWGITTVVKRWGWKTEAELHPVVGIALPLTLGVFSLGLVMSVAQS